MRYELHEEKSSFVDALLSRDPRILFSISALVAELCSCIHSKICFDKLFERMREHYSTTKPDIEKKDPWVPV